MAPEVKETELAVSYFNAHNSICGHQVQMVTDDDQGDPATSLSLARQLVAQGVKIMFNPSLGPSQVTIQPYLMSQKMLIIGISGTPTFLDPATNPSFFSVLPSDNQYDQGTINYIKAKGWNNLGILTDGTPDGTSQASFTQKDAVAAGLTVSKTVTYSPTAVDLTPQLEQLKAAGAQVVVPVGYSDITALASSMKSLGWPQETVSGGAYLDFFVQPTQLPAGTVDGCDVGLPPGSTSLSSLGQPLETLLPEAAAALPNASTFGIWQIYNQLLVAKAAVEKAGSLNSDALISATESLSNLPTDWPGVALTFTASNHTGWPKPIPMCQLTLGPDKVPVLAS